ncbi:MAG TPA: hypothetical protein VL461_11325 [Dictyobacter sp.]|nr:hypothetical protein [Dictyobacter sp.]
MPIQNLWERGYVVVNAVYQQSSSRQLKQLYLVAFGSIAVIAFLGQFFVWFALQQQEQKTVVLGQVYQQELLSQRIQNMSIAFGTMTDPADRLLSMDEMHTFLVQWHTIHHNLERKMLKQHVFSAKKDNLATLWGTTEPAYLDLSRTFHTLTNICMNKHTIVSSRCTTDAITPAIVAVNTFMPRYMNALENVLVQYQQLQASSNHRLQQFNLCLYLSLIIALVLEGICVFRPMVRRLQRAIERARHAEEFATLEHVIADQKRQLDHDIAQILQVQVSVANGDLSARVPLTHYSMLWQVSSGLNTLITRLQRASYAEYELQRKQREIDRLGEMIHFVRTELYANKSPARVMRLDRALQELQLSTTSGSFPVVRNTDCIKTVYPANIFYKDVKNISGVEMR